MENQITLPEDKKINETVLVVFSGGQDSTTCLYWALEYYERVEAITFNYGQNHAVELECAKEICKRENVKQTIIDMSFLATITESALTSNGNVNLFREDGLPDSFVPNRNQLFLTLAHSYAQKIGAGMVIIGACQVDYSGYPDCRQDFIDSLGLVTNMGSNSNIDIVAPLMNMTKAQIFQLADELGKLGEVVMHSHTCYNGERNKVHQWGMGCDECPACQLRKDGYNQFVELKNKSNV